MFVMVFGLLGSSNRGAASGSQVRPTAPGARRGSGATSGGRADILPGNGIAAGATGGGNNCADGALHAPITMVSPDKTAATA
ncbi:hypothetical protein [Saccharopolyspora phatthalungensis]|uniref:Uncharacterized protein n=1 Tax=Saccharopolyspora phatthalungensis TaxID=664693 RepID=A0A840QCX3_9PSEU|nr:hypothetical protein [Saccharopolyspora phatthalungensis]MBB5156295.1 hypothetical protein [Saccharopolyspora phatthalungensis]